MILQSQDGGEHGIPVGCSEVHSVRKEKMEVVALTLASPCDPLNVDDQIRFEPLSFYRAGVTAGEADGPGQA